MRYKQKTLIGILISVLLLNFVKVNSQNAKNSAHQSKKYERLSETFFANKKDTALATKIASDWLKSAKKERSYHEAANAYKALMHVAKKEYRMIYADSLVVQALATNDDKVIGGAYLTIGTAYYNQKSNAEALQNYIKAETFISRTDDPYLSHKISYAIAQTNYHLGYYHEAIAFFSKCIEFFKEENPEAYLRSLHGIGLCYHQIERYDLSSYNNQLGIQFSQDEDYQEIIPYFKNSEGFNKYKVGKYNEAFLLLTNSLTEIESHKDYTTQALTLMYIGKYWLAKQNVDKANDFFIKVDNILTEQKIIHPYLRENFDLLIAYYKDRKNATQRQYYSDKLIEFDKILNMEFRNLSYKIHKEYSSTSLLSSKENKISQDKALEPFYIWFIVLAVGLIIGIIIIVRRYKIKKNNLSKDEPARSKIEDLTVVNAAPLNKMSLEKQQEIVLKLVEFENSKRFLDKGVTLSSLATDLGTNTRYASAIIAYYRGKSVPQYLNDSKIDYLVNLLTEDPNYRKLTNEVLAEKIGFGTTPVFAKAFKQRMKISPNTFITELNKTH